MPYSNSPGDKNGVLSFDDYLDGRKVYREGVNEDPEVIFANESAIRDLKTCDHFVRRQDVITDESNYDVHIRAALFLVLSDGGIGVYDDMPVKRLDDGNSDYPRIVLAEGDERDHRVVVEG